MSATAALILLMEAATACGTVPPDRLDGGAQIAPAILEFEPQVSEPLAPTLAGRSEVRAVPGAHSEADQPDSDPAMERCTAMPLVIA